MAIFDVTLSAYHVEGSHILFNDGKNPPFNEDEGAIIVTVEATNREEAIRKAVEGFAFVVDETEEVSK